VDGVEVRVIELAAAVPLDRRSRERLRTLEEQLVRSPQVIVLLERIDAEAGDEAQSVDRGLEDVVVGRHAAGEPVRQLRVHGQIGELDRVGLNPPVWREEVSVRVAGGQVDEARRIREGVAVTGVVVTVVVPPALVLRAVEGRRDLELEPLADALAEVEA
jgi:hypothetical protein